MRVDFNQDWYFEKDGKWTSVALPHDATIHEDRSLRGMLDFLQANFPGGNYTYRKSFFVPEGYKDKQIYMEFEGVYKHATLFVNGEKVGFKAYGYTQFVVDITKHLKPGEKNEFRVEIECARKMHNRWYAACGIYQGVYLYVSPRNHIRPYGISIKTVSCDPAIIRLEAETAGEGEVSFDIFDGDTLVSEHNRAGERVAIPDARLWSDEDPHLYRCRVSFGADREELFFGVCKLEWTDAQKGFLINGKPTKLRGGCIHNDNGIIGEVTNRATEERRVRNIKASGFNAIRMSHHPASKALLDACDKYGIYVLNEAFDTFYHTKFPQDFGRDFMDIYEMEFENMVRNSRNHPSVIMYSVGNEITEIGTLKSRNIVKRATDIIRALDASRPITIGMNLQMARYFLDGTPFDQVGEDEWIGKNPFRKAWYKIHSVTSFVKVLQFNSNEDYDEKIEKMDRRTTDAIYGMLDINGYNYYSLFYEKIHAYSPDKLLLGTENYVTRNVHNWEKVKKYPYVIGDFVWTLQEHLGEVNCGSIGYGKTAERKYPWISNYAGVLDLLGKATPVLHQYRLCWGLEQGIYLASQPLDRNGIMPSHSKWKDSDAIESWSYGKLDGRKTYVEVYTDAAEAELFLNGRSLGKRKVKQYRARFENITYEPGRLAAVGYNSQGEEFCRNFLQSADTKDLRLEVKADKDQIHADGQDMVFIDISVVDAAGIRHALPEHRICVEVEGSGVLQGFGSANPKNEEKYNQTSHMSYYGQVMAVVRASESPGNITVTVSAEGMERQIIRIYSR